MITILQGNVLDVLPTLPAASFRTCVTSPPYWGLRDYGADGQLGLEKTPSEYVDNMVKVFREVRRVLTDDGTLWLNLGDSYAGSWGAQGRRDSTSNATSISRNQITNHPKRLRQTGSIHEAGLKAKDLIGIPWRVAFALQADGWFLRSDIIWHKPNPMPESVTDRPTKSHEYIFLLSKNADYYYDAANIAEPCESGESDLKKMREQKPRIGGKHKDLIDPKSNASSETNIGQKRSVGDGTSRNKRTVWTVGTAVCKEAHFATFPPALIRPCILAGAPMGGGVLDPFGGSGTTGEVAEMEGRNATLIELNPEYVKIIERRTAQRGLFAS